MTNIRKGFVTALSGIFVYIALLPFAIGSHAKLGLIASVSQMYIPLRQKQEEPIFSDVTDRVQDETATIIEIKDTN